MQIKFVVAAFFVISLSACGNTSSEETAEFLSTQEIAKDSEWPICSVLYFDDKISWPPEETGPRRSAFKLALNIISSFEGHDGWSSIANNFDGMGLSLGLFNQPLGVGSLQPLLIAMRDRHYNEMSRQFSAPHFSALLSMLKAWENGPRSANLDSSVLSTLDMYGENEDDTASSALQESPTSRNSVSASWARSTLYIDGGRTFRTDWKRELQNLASAPPYVSIQVRAAQDYHEHALRLYNEIGISSTRAYLTMFDFVIQNGGLYNSDISQYQNWLRQNPNSTEKQRLTRLLQLRLRHVRPQYVEDVRRRKTAIIEGVGYVHGSYRQLESEYCYNSDWTF